MPEWTAPMEGWVEVRIGGDRVTKVKVENGEDIEVDMVAGEG